MSETITNRVHTETKLPRATLILCENCALNAWKWILREMSPRPATCSGSLCLYDQKHWGNEIACRGLSTEDCAPEMLARLYLITQLGDLSETLAMAHGGHAPNIVTYTDTLDLDIRAVVESPDRFRTALSEHLAFWTRLASHVQARGNSRCASSLPNFQPEDKGPDGLFVSQDNELKIEVQEVKNSIIHPGGRIANNDFRDRGHVSKPRDGKKTGQLLIDFWLFENGIVGFHRLDRLLSEVLSVLPMTSTQSLRAGLLAGCIYNAVVVADESYGSAELFRGYEHVTKQIERRVATYLGAACWKQLADQTRLVVEQTFQGSGVW